MKLTIIAISIFAVSSSLASAQSWGDSQKAVSDYGNLEADLAHQRDDVYYAEQQHRQQLNDVQADIERMRYSSGSHPASLMMDENLEAPTYNEIQSASNRTSTSPTPLSERTSLIEDIRRTQLAARGSKLMIDDEFMTLLRNSFLKRGHNELEAEFEINQYKRFLYDVEDKAEGGDTKLSKVLGDLYTGGKGIKGDEELAIKWYSIAASEGNKEAHDILRDAIIKSRTQRK